MAADGPPTGRGEEARSSALSNKAEYRISMEASLYPRQDLMKAGLKEERVICSVFNQRGPWWNRGAGI